MIFNSEQMEKLRNKYRNVPDKYSPIIIQIDSSNQYQVEREYLEKILKTVPVSARNQLLGRLISDDDNHHTGAWFELMINGWLRQFSCVEPEPQFLGNNPDFIITINELKIAIECKANIIKKKLREENVILDKICSEIRKITLPYILSIEAHKLYSLPKLKKLITEINNWLILNQNEKMIFEDNLGNIIVFKSYKSDLLAHVETMYSVGEIFQTIDSKSLQRSLKNKANQNKNIRKSGMPYVIAIFLEDNLLDASDIVDALFGREVVNYNSYTKDIINITVDQSGIHYRMD